MREREAYPELAPFPYVQAWAEEGSFGPMVVTLAVMSTAVATMHRQFQQVMPAMQAIASQVPAEMRERCYQDRRWVWQQYVRGMAGVGLPGLAGFGLVLGSGLGVFSVPAAVALARGERRADGLPWAVVPDPEDGRRDVESILVENAAELTQIATAMHGRSGHRIDDPETADMLHGFGHYVLTYLSSLAALLTGRIVVLPASPVARVPAAIPALAPPTLPFLACADFVGSVLLPTLLTSGQHPSILYRRACGGDGDALRLLVTMDPSVLHFDRFRSVLVEARSPAARSWLRDLLAEHPASDVAPRDHKLRIVGGVVDRARDLGVRLTRPDVQRLFDALAREASGGQQRLDPDIGDLTEEGLRKAVARAVSTGDTDTRT